MAEQLVPFTGVNEPFIGFILVSLGTAIGAFFQYVAHSRSKRSEQFRIEYAKAASELITAYAQAASGDPEGPIQFARAEAILHLFAGRETLRQIVKLKESKPGSTERIEAHDRMLKCMRKDLSF